jgi:hypothetical protein
MRHRAMNSATRMPHSMMLTSTGTNGSAGVLSFSASVSEAKKVTDDTEPYSAAMPAALGMSSRMNLRARK